MKKIILPFLTLIVLSLTASSLFSQGMYGGGGRGFVKHKPFQHLEMLQYAFDLTNAQVDKIYKIEKDYMDKFYQNRNNTDKIFELKEKRNSEIESLLTAEQKTKWNEFKEYHPKRSKARHNKNYPGFGPHDGMGLNGLGFMQKDLGLSNDQIDKIYKVHKDYIDKFYQDRNDGDKVRELRKKQDSEIENILTAEQKTKWNDYRNKPFMYRDKSGKGKERIRPYMMDEDDK